MHPCVTWCRECLQKTQKRREHEKNDEQLLELCKRKAAAARHAGRFSMDAGRIRHPLLPHVAEQWSHDREIGTLHLILGLVLGTAGTAGAVWMIKNRLPEARQRLEAGTDPVVCPVSCSTGSGRRDTGRSRGASLPEWFCFL